VSIPDALSNVYAFANTIGVLPMITVLLLIVATITLVILFFKWISR
jgi:hypothetical protein